MHIFALKPALLVFKNKMLLLIFLIINLKFIKAEKWNIDLPDSHLKYYFNSFPILAEKCRNDSDCPYKVTIIFNYYVIFKLCQC